MVVPRGMLLGIVQQERCRSLVAEFKFQALAEAVAYLDLEKFRREKIALERGS